MADLKNKDPIPNVSLLGKLFLSCIGIYQYAISPLFPSRCRHFPTCSQYAREAVLVHGAYKGALLSVKRILRCHPWGTHGYDPVPEKIHSSTSCCNR